MIRTLLLFSFLACSCFVLAQMPDATGTVTYGNEWIDYDRPYLRIAVAEDGVYRITPEQLAGAGIGSTGGDGLEWELWNRGQLVPVLENAGSLYFRGEQNRGEMDRFLFEDPDRSQLNDRYSMHSDTAVYFLSRGNKGLAYRESTLDNAGTTLNEITRESEIVFGEHYTKTFFRTSGSSIYHSYYDVADGFGSREANDLLALDEGTTESNFELALPAAVAGGAAELSLRYGLAFDAHEQIITVAGAELRPAVSSGWSVRQVSLPFTVAGTSADVSVRGIRGDRDKANLAWARITYPALPDASGLTHFIAPAAAQTTRLSLTNLGADAGAVFLLDASTGTSISGSLAGSTAEFILPASAGETRYDVITSAVVRAPADLSTRTFTAAGSDPERSNYLILTSERLNGPEVADMAAYRSSPGGGAYRVKVVEVESLYDEFGHGISRHPMALRNYLAYAKIQSPELQYLFLIGKGREFEDLRTAEQLAEANSTFFVPSFGFPASDNMLSAALGNVVPAYSTGRLAAINKAEIGIYLQKLRDVESQVNTGSQTLEDRDWMKQVIHLGGGGVIGEQNSIRNRLGVLERTIEGSNMGGNVTSFFKTSSDPIETSQQDAIFNRINAGASMITFYGHSSSNGFDFSIDDPANYNNQGRYPYMLSLGCFSGDAFVAGRSISERFIFLPNKGAVAFAASKGIGFISALGLFANNLYDLTGNDLYGQGIGDAMRANLERYQNSTNFTIQILTEQFALSGDPAYSLHPRPGADLVVDAASVRFEPEVIPAQNLSFDLSFRVVNLGINGGQDSITIDFRQELPSGEIRQVATRRILAPTYDRVVRLTIPNVGLEAVGQNRLFITLDSGFELAELPLPAAESNNELQINGRAGIPITFIANTAKVAFPPEFAVLDGPVSLVSSTTDALAPEREYLLQVSKRKDFRDLLVDERIVSPGGVIRHDLNIPLNDSTAYYWRISPDSSFTEGAGFIWSESSFTWMDGEKSAAWAQQDPGQLVSGEFENIEVDSFSRGWNYRKDAMQIRVFNGIYRSRTFPRYMRRQQQLASPFLWRITGGMSVMVLDSINNNDWLRNPGQGAYSTRPGLRTTTWDFNTRNLSGRKGMIDFLNEAVPEGKYVLIWSLQRGSNNLNYYTDDWASDEETLGTTIFDVLEDEGALEIRRLTTSGPVPYVLAFQKGLGLIGEVMADSIQDEVELDITIFGNWDQGSWTSSQVGPAKEWRGIKILAAEQNVEAVDTVIVTVTGQDITGVNEVLKTVGHRFFNDPVMEIDLSDINASAYPKIQLKIELLDGENRTATELTGVYFDYDPVGDVAVNPQLEFTQPDSIQQGERAVLSVGYENISDVDMDSMLVQIDIIDKQNRAQTRQQRKMALPAGERGNVQFELETVDISSDVRWQVLLNPDEDQPEDVTFNNVLTAGFAVGRDEIDPVLTVLFDGQRINDGDMISGRPEIRIQLRDNNQFLRLNDTSAYQLRLTSPSGSEQTIAMTDERIEFVPATEADNKAEIFFRPELLEDGEYELEVSGRDRSGNTTGRLEFRRSFEVINEMQVGDVLAYPNPFTTQTRFVYTLTGSEQPSMFRIQIMTVSGRVVRDIDLLATENLKVGTHQTEFAWDGTDEYGDLLANGVYLYRVITSDGNGESLEKRNTGMDQYFERELGKVVILR